jgi:hypothetical protein
MADSSEFCDSEVLAIKLAVEMANLTTSKWRPYLEILKQAPLDSAL